jgi:hypothetical protein
VPSPKPPKPVCAPAVQRYLEQLRIHEMLISQPGPHEVLDLLECIGLLMSRG